MKMAVAKAKASRHAKEQDRLLRRLSGTWCSFDSDDDDASTSGSGNDDDDTPLQADACTEEGYSRMDDRVRNGPARKW
ncbi:hypothetical protein D1007_16591 [Hordeum vulgare]|nr:hypothetical protein D1007_16591 [Hordeum vulgare]